MWVVLVGIAVFAIVSAVGTWRRAKRQQGIQAIAHRAGLQYAREDPFGCTRVSFALFGKGDGRGAENVVWRDAEDGHSYRAFDFWYDDEDAEGNKTYHRYSCAMALVGSAWPDIRIVREGVVSKVTSVVAGGDIDFESEEFNRMFSVRCGDRRFATALLDAQMLELLVSTRGELSFELKGRWLLVWTSPVQPPLVPGLLGVAESFVRAIPTVVWDLYPSTFVDEHGRPLAPGDDAMSQLEMEAALGELRNESDPFAVLEHSPFEALERHDGVEYDLDGNRLPKREERPWG